MESLTLTDWQSFFLVLIAVCGLFLLICNVVEKIKAIRKPGLSVEERLHRDNERITDIEEQMRDTNEAINLMLQSTLALISHMITGNGVEKLKDTQSKVQDYLINRR